jgi:hypothetical protein
MAGQQRRLIFFGILAISVSSLCGQTPQPAGSSTPAATPQPFTQGQGRHQGGGGLVEAANSPELENVRKAIEALTPEERSALREKEDVRHQRMAEEVEAALQQTGLQLEPGRRAQFAKRYAEERRKLEERLRQETEEKRRPAVQQIIARLKSEFSSANTAAATPTPQAIPTGSP